MMHPSQIFLHNPRALRVEFRLDDQRLMLWWSPKAGESFDAVDRNFSNRDDHLDVFDAIQIPGCDNAAFEGCDYDPYHAVLRFRHQTLHLAVATGEPVLMLWCERPQRVMFKTQRYDHVLEQTETAFVVAHDEPGHRFEFAACCAPGASPMVGEGVRHSAFGVPPSGGAFSSATQSDARLKVELPAEQTRGQLPMLHGDAPGGFRHCHFRGPNASAYSEAVLEPGVPLGIGVGLAGGAIATTVQRLVGEGTSSLLAANEAVLEASIASGRIRLPSHPGLEHLRDKMVRGLHSMIDDSGAMRASIKAIYYLIWVRDAGFCFPYQSASGWPHRLPELCRLLLSNPTTVRGGSLPEGRMFAQLVNKDYGKYEEDGIFYVLWVAMTHWTQTGDNSFVSGEALALLEEAMDWVESAIFDEERGLFGQHFADETPSVGSRDDAWDYAIGQPGTSENPCYEGIPIARFYDTYINVLMHAAWTMLAAVTEGTKSETYTAKAAALWEKTRPFFEERTNGLPQYGELLLADGRRVTCPPWKLECTTVYVWALSLPTFVPIDDWDGIRQNLLGHIMAHPTLFWINGLCSTIAGVDTICYDENHLLAALEKIREETETPGPFLPMGGAMPEKLGAPQGNLYHDIRPQAFAMGSFLGALASLGIRRLPYGLALRPTAAISTLENYPWRGRTLHFEFEPSANHALLEINGTTFPGTLQLPESALNGPDARIRIRTGQPGLRLVRSTVRLESVSAADGGFVYSGKAFGLSEMTFDLRPGIAGLFDDKGTPIPFTVGEGDALHHLRFVHKGLFVLRTQESPSKSD